MAKPSGGVVSWASDANFTSGPETGNPTKVNPSAGAKAQGQVPGQPYRGQRMNWLFNLLGLWTGYLNNLPNETDFTGQPFAWGGQHTFPIGTPPDYTSTGLNRGLSVPLLGGEEIFASTSISSPLGEVQLSVDALASATVKWRPRFNLPQGCTVQSYSLGGTHNGLSQTGCVTTAKLYQVETTFTAPFAVMTQIGTTQTNSSNTSADLGLSEIGLAHVTPDAGNVHFEMEITVTGAAGALAAASTVKAINITFDQPHVGY